MRVLKSIVSTILAVAIMHGGIALAQDTDTSPEIEEVIVTGSHIRRDGYSGVSPIQVVGREAIQAAGVAQIQDIARTLTVNSGSEVQNESASFLAGTAQFNVRGLGLGSTLTLINGRRAGFSPVSDANGVAFFDINTLPLTMIERIEVLTDGASATYGSEAVGGVVNVITRKGFEGIEITAEVRDALNETYSLGVAAGAGTDRSVFNVYASYYKQSGNVRTDFDWLVDRVDGAGDLNDSALTSSTGSPGTYRRALVNPDGTIVVDPAFGARVPDPDCVEAGGIVRDNRCRLPFNDKNGLIPDEERFAFLTEGSYTFNDKVEFFGELGASHNKILRRDGAGGYRAGLIEDSGETYIPGDHPFNFFIADPADPSGIQYIGPANWDNAIHTGVDLSLQARPFGRDSIDGPQQKDQEDNLFSVRSVTGLEFSLPGDWIANTSFQYALNNLDKTAPYNFATDKFVQFILDGAWNPFGTRLVNPTLISPKDGSSTAGNSQDLVDQFSLDKVESRRTVQQSVDLLFTGELLDMPSGSLGLAFGGQYRSDSLEYNTDSLNASNEHAFPGNNDPVINGKQKTSSIFAEADIPLYDMLDVQLAVRHESFSGDASGETTDPKVALRWQPNEWLGLRGSYGTSFQGAALLQRATARQFLIIDDPAVLNTVTGVVECGSGGPTSSTVFIVAGGDDLKPQSAKNFNMGAVVTKGGLSVSVDYWNFDYTDLITQEEGAQAILDNDCSDDGIPNDPRVFRNPDGLVGNITSSFINTGSVETDGFDVSANYLFDLSDGQLLTTGIDLTYVNNFDVVTSDGATPFDGAGSRNFSNQFRSMPDLRGNATLGWSKGGHTATAIVRYISSYDQDQTSEIDTIDSWTTFDLQYALQLSEVFGVGDGATFTIGAVNVLDEDPPTLGQNTRPGYDQFVHDVRGRQVYLRLVQAF